MKCLPFDTAWDRMIPATKRSVSPLMEADEETANADGSLLV
jgi:hypothetical protein